MIKKNWKEKISIIISNYVFILKMLWKSTPAFFSLLILFTLLECFFPISTMLLMKNILDLIASESKTGEVLFILLVLVMGSGLLNIIQQLLAGIKNYIRIQTLNIVGKDMIYLVQEKAASLDLKFFDTPLYYQKLENVKRVMNRQWDFLLVAPVNFVGSLITLVTMAVILASFAWWLIPVIVIGACPDIFVQLSMRRKINDFYTEQIPENRKIGYTENLLSDKYFAKEVRIFGLTDYILRMAQSLFKAQYRKIKKIQLWQAKINFIWSTVATIAILVCQVVITVAAFKGIITIGSWQFYTQASFSISSSLNALFGIVADSSENDFYTNILKEFMETKPAIEFSKGISYPIARKAPLIRFDNVCFAYPDPAKIVLQNINFIIKPGEKIALVGLNGSGKTTLIKLLTRLYDPTGGEILFDGVNIKMYKPSDLYKIFSVIFQDFSRYAFTLKENIAIGSLDKNNDDNAIKSAASLSGADKIAGKLDNGYDSYITKAFDLHGCSDLSGGEWQKIAIARCFFSNAPIVILDEPTASLDPEAEYEIYNQFIELCTNKTAIIISHRLSSVRMVDRIFLIKDGMLFESGTHKELINQMGEYKRLFNLQASQYVL